MRQIRNQLRILLIVSIAFITVTSHSFKIIRNRLPHHIKSISSLMLVCLSLNNVADVHASINKQPNLPLSQLSQIVARDITVRQTLITADFSSQIYDDNCKFQDEIDTYDYQKYVKGTKALFNAEQSHVDLIGNVDATEKKVEFKFKETLAFNIPFNPKVKLSGHVELTRGENGLITYSREYWDQSVPSVLSTVYF